MDALTHRPRTAVIGYGFAGRSFHSYLISITPGLELVGIASRNAETRAKIVDERGCHAYTSFEEVLADDSIDLVVLGSPHEAHAEQAITALNAGKHVVTDKPMSLNLAECDEMIAAAERSGKLLSVFHNRRWDGDFLTLRAAIDSGRLGPVRWIELAWQNFGPQRGWRGEAERGGGRILDLGAHLADQLQLVFPQPVESVYCRVHRDFPTSNADSECLVVIAFADGCTGVIDLSSRSAIKKPRIQAHGETATFVKYGLDPQENAMKAGDIDSAVEDPAHYARIFDGTQENILPTIPGRWRSYYENIADTLTGKATLAVTPQSVRRTMQILDAANRSAASGQSEPVEE